MPRFRTWNALHLGVAAILMQAQLGAADPPSPDLLITTWTDHATFSAFNTAVGIPLAAIGLASSAINGDTVSVRIDDSGRQLVLGGASLNQNVDYSTGAFHHGDSNDDGHEAGHSHQSAVLGPAYLPVVGLTYLAYGDTSWNRIESWAEQWAKLDETFRDSHPLRLRLEIRNRDGRPSQVIGTNFVLMERASRVNTSTDSEQSLEPVTVAYRYGTLDLGVRTGGAPGMPCGSPRGLPLIAQAGVFQRDFQLEWSTVSEALRILLDGRSDAGHVTIDLDRKRLDLTALRQQVGAGVRIGTRETLALDAVARANLGLSGTWDLGPRVGEQGMRVTGGVQAEARAHAIDRIEIFARRESERGTDGYRREASAFGMETPALFTARALTTGDTPTHPTRIQAGVQRSSERETRPGPAGTSSISRVHMTLFTVGGRF